MSLPGRIVHLRLPPRLQHRLEALHSKHFGGLPVSTVLKMLVADQLAKEESALVNIVACRIKTPGDDSP